MFVFRLRERRRTCLLRDSRWLHALCGIKGVVVGTIFVLAKGVQGMCPFLNERADVAGGSLTLWNRCGWGNAVSKHSCPSCSFGGKPDGNGGVVRIPLFRLRPCLSVAMTGKNAGVSYGKRRRSCDEVLSTRWSLCLCRFP